MKHKKILFPALLLLLASVGSSCRKLISDEFPDMEPKPVVNAIIEDGEPIVVYVSLARKIDPNPLDGVNNATVNLFVDGAFAETLTYAPTGDSGTLYAAANHGFYIASISGNQGKHYALEVSIPLDGDTLKAKCETYLPEAEKIINVEFIENAGKHNDGYTIPALKVTFTNHPARRQYYYLAIKTCYMCTSETDSGIVLEDTFALSGGYLELYNITDPVMLGEGFPIPVFTNRLIGDSVYTMYAEFSSGGYHSGSATNGVVYMSYSAVSVELRTIDEAYYHYLRSYHLYDLGINGSDIGAVYSPFPPYSNVSGGYGMFSAYSKSETYYFYPQHVR